MLLTTRIFRPVMNAGVVWARLRGSTDPMQSIGGIEELKIDISEDVKKQVDFSRPGGGTRAQVQRLSAINMAAKLQDLNIVNMARAFFGTSSSVAAATVTGEAATAQRGGLIRLAHINPTSVIVKAGATTIAASGNYEVLPEGLFIYDAAPDLDGIDVTVDYAHDGYDLLEALTEAAPILEMAYAGVNEADGGKASTVDLFRVQLGATKSLGLIDKDFGTLDIEGEVLLDPTKTGAGISRFFRVQIA